MFNQTGTFSGRVVMIQAFPASTLDTPRHHLSKVEGPVMDSTLAPGFGSGRGRERSFSLIERFDNHFKIFRIVLRSLQEGIS